MKEVIIDIDPSQIFTGSKGKILKRLRMLLLAHGENSKIFHYNPYCQYLSEHTPVGDKWVYSSSGEDYFIPFFDIFSFSGIETLLSKLISHFEKEDEDLDLIFYQGEGCSEECCESKCNHPFTCVVKEIPETKEELRLKKTKAKQKSLVQKVLGSNFKDIKHLENLINFLKEQKS